MRSKTKKEIELIKQAEIGVGKNANLAMVKLRQEFDKSYHYCEEWDFMVICDKDREFDCCMCNLGL